ncbi:hypothetical protein [Aridibaculum aurantiacum]|uniref:hypothetical protein n=1 Tax=Aridibaculum aurantiacum TaxID=2810307 RepID=UPI001A97166A|nr:hypothetical protein [Aridibaculum aurantiacum]
MKAGEKEKKEKKVGKFIYYNMDKMPTPPDRSKFFGILKSKVDPVKAQRKLRDEWE